MSPLYAPGIFFIMTNGQGVIQMNTFNHGAALVTGASSGIGAIYARKLAQRGYDLILVARNRKRLNEMSGEFSSLYGVNVAVWDADLTDPDQVQMVERHIKAQENLTLLVNNAGFGGYAPLLESDVNKMDEMIQLNVTALTRLTYAAVPGFVARGRGAIINIASIVAIAPEILNGVYGASKAYVQALSYSLHHELKDKGIQIQAYVSQVGDLTLQKPYTSLNLELAEDNIVRCPDPEFADQMIALIDSVRLERDTIGGVVSCVIKNCPPGLGEPVFDRLHAELGKAMLSINAVKGFEYGSGFEGVKMRGSQHNDAIVNEAGKIHTTTNHSGGIQGGISNGEDIYFRVAFKPVATIMQDQESVNEAGEAVTVSGKGRHDPCVVPRAVPIVEAMAALVLADFLLISKTNKLSEI